MHLIIPPFKPSHLGESRQSPARVSMPRLDRRSFLKTSTALSGAALAPSLAGLVSCMPSAVPVATPTPSPTSAGSRRGREGGYGPLRPAGPELALPEGFSYLKFGVEGTMMSDGNRTPGGHDGMAAFAMPNGNIRLIRNHELRATRSCRRRSHTAMSPRR